MEEIQKKTIKRSKRNPVSRLLHAKNDKDVIAAWKLDLDRILRVFNVCFVVAARLLLTVHVQTELAISTRGMVSDDYYNIANAYTMISDCHHGERACTPD